MSDPAQISDLPTNSDPSNVNDAGVTLRKLVLTPASAIPVKRVRWTWEARIAEGTIALLAGREGLGKSTLAYQLAAQITRGTLEGEDHNNPRAVLVCANEDSWEHTIVPRLIAADADLEKIYRIEVETHDHYTVSLSLPRDYKSTREAAEMVDAGMLILDPLMSVIDHRLDTHRDREVRQALEPLKALAEQARMAILGLIHHNKSGSTDALQLVMGSKAFSAVARSVHTCIPDPDDDTGTRRLFATSKNNLGRLDLPVLGFTIAGHPIETPDDGTAWTGRLNWTGEVEGSMTEIMTRTADPERSATAEAADWLTDFLADHGGEDAKTNIEKAGRVAGHSATALRRARERLHLEHRSAGFPRQTYWALPNTQITPDETDETSSRVSGGDTTGDTTAKPDENGNHPVASPKQDELDIPSVMPVTSTPDTTATQLDLTSTNTTHAGARAYTRGDDPTDTTDSVTPLDNPSRASHASRVTHPPRPRATTNPWLDHIEAGHIPNCSDCGHPLDSTNHEQACDAATTIDIKDGHP